MLSILKRKSSSFENMFLLFVSAVLPWFLPVIHQSADYHGFEDSGMLLGIHNFMEVFSNIWFLLSGVLFLLVIFKNKNKISDYVITLYITFALGSIITAFGSNYYHLNPYAANLALDQLPMTITFVGLLSLMAYQATKKLYTASMLRINIVFGISSILYWTQTLSLTSYLFMQFGRLIWIAFHMSKEEEANSNLLDWPMLIIFYVLTKIMVSFDAQIFNIFGHMLSGHTLKHYFAAIGITLIVYKLSKTLSRN